MDDPTNRTTLGQKIRNFRRRAGLSQLDLEVKIDASPGSLSRIENDQINPTKETLIKIIEALSLKTYEAGSLFNLDYEELPKMVALAKKLNSTLDSDQVLQNAVNEIAYELDLLGVVICLIEKDELVAKTFTQSWYSKLVISVMQIPFKNLRIKIDNDIENFMLLSTKYKKEYFSNSLYDFCKGVLSHRISDLAQNVTGHKVAISFPIMYEDKPLGAILFSKNYVDDFKQEYNILKAFSENVAMAIINAQKYQKLQEEINILKNGK